MQQQQPEPDRDTRRRVYQSLKEMGFHNEDIKAAIQEHGYDVERCANFLVNAKNSKKRLYVGMDVWYYSIEDNDWVPANIVSITKQLISVIFNGHDFRWLEKDSEHYTTKSDKPEPLMIVNETEIQSEESDDQQNMFSPPKPDEMDYDVVFPESVLGLELYSDEDGYNCIVGRCVSQIAQQKVTPGSQIIQVNDRWLANYKFEEIRDAVKQAAKQPPLQVKFRIRKIVIQQRMKQSNDPQPQSSQQQQQQPQQPQQIHSSQRQVQPQQPRTSNLFSPSNPNHMIQPQQQQYVQNSYVQPSYDSNPQQPEQQQQQQQQPPFNSVQQVNVSSSNNNNNVSSSNKNSNENMNVTSDLFPSQNESRYPSHSIEEEKLPQPKEPDFVPHMTIDQAELLMPQDTIDHRDDVGRFLLASIVDKRGSQLKIHYEGWNSKWDMWCDYKKEIHRFAAPKSISRKPNTRLTDLKIRDYVDINPSLRHKGWRVGQIRRLDRYSGQAQIVYKEDGQEFLYWAHLNNKAEIAPFMTKAEESLHKMQEQQRQQSQQYHQQYNHQQSSQERGYEKVPEPKSRPLPPRSSNNKQEPRSRPLPPTLRNKLPPKPPRKNQNQNQNQNQNKPSNIPPEIAFGSRFDSSNIVYSSNSRFDSGVSSIKNGKYEPQKQLPPKPNAVVNNTFLTCPMCQKFSPMGVSSCSHCGTSFD